MKLIQELKSFGFDDKEARVYLALLELGTAKAIDIAKKANVTRPTVYDQLSRLSQNGLVGFFNKREVRYYVAESPEKIKKQFAEKQTAFEALLPELKSVYNTLYAKPKITYYEGVEGIKTILDDTLTAKKKQLQGILSVIDLFEIPGKAFMEKYVAKRIEEGIWLKVLRSKPKEVYPHIKNFGMGVKEYWPTDPKAFRELRYVPQPMVFSMTMYLYDNKVSLISSQKENFGMIIESEEFYSNMSNMFDALWQVSNVV